MIPAPDPPSGPALASHTALISMNTQHSASSHPQGQWDGEAAGATAAVADGGALHAALLVEPGQHLVHRLRVALPDVQLHLRCGWRCVGASIGDAESEFCGGASAERGMMIQRFTGSTGSSNACLKQS